LQPPPLLKAFLPGIVSALCAYLLVTSLLSGVAPALGRRSLVLGLRHSANSDPSQYWFMLVLFLAGALGFGYLAWREYRD
jgi:hypothetical protein